MHQHQSQALTSWQFKVHHPSLALTDDFASEHEWLPATVPGCTHLDLLASRQIPDPYYGTNELEVQWVGEREWLYRCSFDVTADSLASSFMDLCFDGLDTFATVWLNGTRILSSDNMFVPHQLQVKSLLRAEGNILWLHFASALEKGREREARFGTSPLWNGDSSRLYVRKAQYHYGWDWGPTLLTAGAWRPVHLEAYDAQIADVACPVEVEVDLSQARFPVQATVKGAANDTVSLILTLLAPDGRQLQQATLPIAGSTMAHTFTVDAPDLWWPHGYGKQPLYQITATLTLNDDIIDTRSIRLGVRRLELVQTPLADASEHCFGFAVNNTPIFCGGANWIPDDMLLTRSTPQRYRHLLQLAADAHMTMLRVWGGGIYEDDAFYDACDELGLLVWQDCMFACGLYPAQDWFQQSVKAEIEAAVLRLRHHPAIVLWCGNNEDYILASSLGRYSGEVIGEGLSERFPARAIYEQLLPQTIAALDPTRPYWPGSPYGGNNGNNGELGDQHIWDVWHGAMSDYHDYPRFDARFVSEFGMEAYPALDTLTASIPEAERFPQSHAVELHNKAGDGPRRLSVYLSDTVRIPTDLDNYTFATQVMQAEALTTAICGWRRRWDALKGGGVSGALVWQLNDCWPAISWAIVDYKLHPKLAYYTIKRALAPISIGLARTESDHVALWGVNGTLATFDTVDLELEITTWTLQGARVDHERRPVQLAANSVTEFGLYEHHDARHIISARLMQYDTIFARATLWPEPFKYLHFPEPHIHVKPLGGNTFRVYAQRPAKSVWLAVQDDTQHPVRWSDNTLDLMPNDPQIITLTGSEAEAANIQVRWLM